MPPKAAKPAAAGAPKPITRYITLNEWAASQFSRPPHYNTLIKWVHDGRIQPQPVKIGRAWQVRPHAEYICD
ncbi:excisionase [Massilia sp. DWR3-1-1]|uniref:excisionase n=1 Tax=Massilia sp. DWR3-1-1 TaxID=2804559 RepID=UPI003CF92BA5